MLICHSALVLLTLEIPLGIINPKLPNIYCAMLNADQITWDLWSFSAPGTARVIPSYVIA